MKRLFLSLIVGGMISTAAMAQDSKTATNPQQQTPQQQKAEWDKKVKADLNLTTEQAVKYDALGKEYGEKFDAIMNDASLTDDAKKEKKMALKKEKETKLNEFLTPDQQAKYKELVQKKMKEMKDKPGN